MASQEHNLEPEFDALLKMHVQQRATTAVCYQFDPDEATAYLEHALSKTALTSFEEHLASCGICRRHLIELSRLMPSQPVAVEPMVVTPSFKDRLSEWFADWHFGALAGIGAVAATVLCIAIVVNRSNNESAPLVATNQGEVKSTPLPEPGATTYSSDENKRADKTMPSASPAANAPLTDHQAIAKNVPSATPAMPAQSQAVNENRIAAAAPPPPPAVTLPAPTKTESERKDLPQTTIAEQKQIQNLRAQTPAGPEVNQSQVDRALDRSRKSSEAQEKSADAAVVVSETAKSAPKAKEEKPSERVVEKRRAELDEVADLKKSKVIAAKPVSTAAASAARGRAVSGKTFRQENGAWVDEAYDVNKGLPLVRLKHDSDEYKQTLKDNPGLKPYFDLKPVVVVWQGKVYRVEK